MNAMRSIASSDRKRHDNARVDSGNDEALYSIGDTRPTPEDELIRKNLRAAVLALFEGDAVAHAICEGWFFDQMTDKELGELTDLDPTTLASRKRAITRKLIKSDVGAHLR